MSAQPIVLTSSWRITCIVLQLLPIPGVGAIIAGIKNPHTGLLGRGIAQVALVLFGSWPLIIPGAAGLVWAIVDAVRIGRHSVRPARWSLPTPDAEPSTLDLRKEQRMAARAARRAGKAEAKAAKRAAREAERARQSNE